MNQTQIVSLKVSPEKGSGGGASDERENILSVSATCRLLGLKRTQVWRYAKDGTLSAIILGTARRPEHYFRRTDVINLKAQRDAATTKSGKRRQRRAQPKLRQLLALLEAGEIDLAALPALSGQV